MAVAFYWDSRDLAVFRGGKVEKALGRSMRLAGNAAFKVLQKGTTDLVLRKKSLPRALITADQREIKPSRSDVLKDFAWTLWVRGKPVPMMVFPKVIMMRGARTRSIRVSFGPGNSKVISNAFTARMKSGHIGIFRRTGKKALPIEELFSSRLPGKLGGEVMSTLADPVYRKVKTSFERGLDREMKKLVRKGES